MPASVGGSELSLGRKMYVMSEGLATPLLHVRPLLHLLLVRTLGNVSIKGALCVHCRAVNVLFGGGVFYMDA